MGKRTGVTFVSGFLLGVLAGALLFTGTAPPPASEPASPPAEPGPELVDLRSVFQQIPDDELLYRFPNDAFLSLLAMADSGPALGTEEERWEAQMLLGQVFGHLKKLQEEPFYRARFTVGQNMAHHPVLGDYTLAVDWNAPWIVFAAGRKGDANDLALQVIARRAAEELGGLHRRVFDLLGKRLGLPELAGRADLDERILKVVVFQDEALFFDYTRRVGPPAHPRTLADYREDERLATTFGELESPRQRASLRYAAMHQLLHAFRKILLEQETGREVLWDDDALDGRLEVFDVGLAAMLSDPGGESHHLPNLNWAKELGIHGFSLHELLSIRNGPELMQRARRKNLGRAEELEAVFQSQAWALIHFLWHFEDGRYREQFLEYATRDLRGDSGPEVFARVFWGEQPPDVNDLYEQWLGYLDGLLRD